MQEIKLKSQTETELETGVVAVETVELFLIVASG